MTFYKIVRFYQRSDVENRLIKEHLFLREAQDHCNDPETSSKTCTTSEALRETEENGPWFDGYMREEKET